MKDMYFCIVLLITMLLIEFIAFIGIFLLPTYKYAYIDLNGRLGISNRCRDNYCEINDKKTLVKEFISVRKD